MKKKSFVVIGLISTVILAVIIFKILHPTPVWEINADEFKHSFQPISGNSVIDDLSQWTPFEWDTLYSFAPYTSREKIYESIGYKWDNISETVNEGMNQIVFVKDSKVVCYLYGYPEKLKLGFNFGQYEGSYIKLTSKQKLSFKTTFSEKSGVRYFEYIK